jgi:putative peptide zinc metalloprotease protein
MTPIVAAPLRQALKVSKLVQQGELSYVIKEPDKQAYYHFSDAQYDAITLFDGARDLQAVVDTFNQTSQVYEFDLQGISELYETCREYQLLRRSKREKNAALLEKISEERKKKLLQGQGSILFLRFQLVDPNDFFDKVIDKIRFFWHPTAVKIQLLFLLCATLLVLFQGERFLLDFNRVYLQSQQGAWGYLSIWLIALFAIAIHECGHGLTCKHFGGDVHEMGFLLLAFQPCLYCNVNDAWLFENKWQKIYVALAGVWVELLLAGLSAFVWLLVDVANPIGFIAFVLLTIGTATSLLINLNPLLKFDGYYILTDMLEIPNLRQNAIAWFSWTLKTRVLRLDDEAPFSPLPRERWVYLIYGALVTVYMIAILSFLAIIGYGFVSEQFGFFANLAFIYLVLYLIKKITNSWGETLINWTHKVFWRTRQRQITTGVAGILLLLALIFWQPQIRIHSTGQVAAGSHIIYAPQSGFIAYVGFDAGRKLINAPGQAFLQLTSPQLMLAKTELENAQQLLKMQQQEAVVDLETAKSRRLLIEKSLLDEKIHLLVEQGESLSVIAPAGDWMVEGLPPQSLLGRYFSSGDEIVTLISKKQRFVDVIVDQRDVHFIKPGDRGRIRFTGVAAHVYSASVTRISPVAKLAGIEQSLLVRMEIDVLEQAPTAPLGLSAEIIIFGQPTALWRHIHHEIRKILRADLWL